MKPILKMRSKVKGMLLGIKESRYHYMHKKDALQTLSTIEKERGKLSESIRSQCDQYAKNYLGDIKYAPWLYVYSAMQGEFKEGWLPCNYYGLPIVRDIDRGYAKISELKPVTNHILRTNKLPDLLYVNNDYFIEPDSYHVVSFAQASELLFSENDTVIFKPNESVQGKGVRTYTRDEWNSNLELRNGVFQKIIKQHPFFDNLFPHPGATIRITTGLDANGNATARSAYIRLGRSNDDSVARHVQCSNEVRVVVNIETGELSDTGYLASWNSTQTHPDTHTAFKGLVVPAFKDARQLVEELHANYPFVLVIGWDISINEHEQVEIIEWNTAHNDIKFSEAVHGPCFKDILAHATKKPFMDATPSESFQRSTL